MTKFSRHAQILKVKELVRNTKTKQPPLTAERVGRKLTTRRFDLKNLSGGGGGRGGAK